MKLFSFVKFAIGILAIFLLVGSAGFFYITKDLPNPEILASREIAESTKIFDRTGKVLLYEIHGDEKRTVVPFEEIPDHIKQAAIAIEDENFYEHSAIDFKSIIRAFIKNLTRRGIVQGGSTITQQLAKNAFLTSEKTFDRKIKELILAIYLEKRLSKDEILSFYLNQIPYGSSVYGIESASQTFFEKPAKELTLAEAALLAALPKAPTYYSPWGSHTDELLGRKDLILEKMSQLGFITEEQKKQAQQEKLRFAVNLAKIKAPHFVMSVQEYLNNKYGEDFARTAGLQVTTTLDWEFQQIAEEVVSEGAQRNNELYQGKNAALVAQDANTGQILALVGSQNYFDIESGGNFNVATQGLRQPGSAIKPLAYAVAFEKGLTPETVVFDLETEFDTTGIPEKSYKPQNFDEKFRGPISLRNALAQSVNIPAVKVLYMAGIDNLLKLAKTLGINSLNERSRYGLSLVLGGGEVKLYELVGAYSVFAREGTKHKQTMILEVKNRKGEILEQFEDKTEQVLNPQTARLINEILSDADARAPLFANSLNLTVFPGYQVALKTGTTNDYRDAWAIGYTPNFVIGVWAGNNDNEPMQSHAGSILAAVPIWNNFIEKIIRKYPNNTFLKPEAVVGENPMFRGEYIVNYQSENNSYPQIHNVLFYINKKSPQFDNWEKPVLEWAEKNIPDFATAYNKFMPENSIFSSNLTNPTINFTAPENGSFIKNNELIINADIKSNQEISKIEVYLNNRLIDSKNQKLGNEYNYSFQTANLQFNVQNLLKIVAVNSLNVSGEKEIILYK